MALEKLLAFTKDVQDLPDKPNATMTTADLKVWFDSAPDEVRQYLNTLIDNLTSVVDGDSGADNIGATAIAGLSGATVQALLESLKALDDTNRAYLLEQINGLVLGQIPDESLTQSKFSTSNTSVVRFAVDTGTTNAKVVTLTPAPTIYVEGMAIAFKNAIENTGVVTININGLGAKSVLKSNGNALTSGNLKADSVYTLRYNGTSFILQGEGGEYGTAVAGDVRSTKTIGTENGIQQGTLNLDNLIPSNVRVGVAIGGITGNMISDFPVGNNLVASNDTAKTYIQSGTLSKMKAIVVPKGGTYRVSFTAETTDSVSQIFVNGVARGTLRTQSVQTATTYTEDIPNINTNDEIAIYGRKKDIYTGTGLYNFRLYVDLQFTNTLI